MRYAAHIATILLTALLSGCATPSARISRSPEVFADFPAEVQEMVRRGEIAIGFNKDMVYLALGAPDRRYMRTTRQGEIEVWSYTAISPGTSFSRRHHRSFWHPWYGYYDPFWYDPAYGRTYEYLRVEFADGKVAAIEEMQP